MAALDKLNLIANLYQKRAAASNSPHKMPNPMGGDNEASDSMAKAFASGMSKKPAKAKKTPADYEADMAEAHGAPKVKE